MAPFLSTGAQTDAAEIAAQDPEAGGRVVFEPEGPAGAPRRVQLEVYGSTTRR